LKKFENINIIPFVDVMLVLLAIVLTTSTLIEKHLIPVSLPSASKSNEKIKKDQITITIKKNGEFYFQEYPITFKDLQKKISSLNKETQISINCDKEAKFENFVKILDILKQNDLENISIVTKADE
jgi:biopolymer transport protein ExbD